MLFVIAIGLYTLSSIALFALEFKKMGLGSRIFLIIQFVALLLMVIAWLGISF
jgi:hypothetical protein